MKTIRFFHSIDEFHSYCVTQQIDDEFHDQSIDPDFTDEIHIIKGELYDETESGLLSYIDVENRDTWEVIEYDFVGIYGGETFCTCYDYDNARAVAEFLSDLEVEEK